MLNDEPMNGHCQHWKHWRSNRNASNETKATRNRGEEKCRRLIRRNKSFDRHANGDLRWEAKAIKENDFAEKERKRNHLQTIGSWIKGFPLAGFRDFYGSAGLRVPKALKFTAIDASIQFLYSSLTMKNADKFFQRIFLFYFRKFNAFLTGACRWKRMAFFLVWITSGWHEKHNSIW